MKRRATKQTAADAFETVRTVGLALPGVEATTKYDGSPVLKVRGTFMAGLAAHRSAAPETLVVRCGFEEREWLMEDAPEMVCSRLGRNLTNTEWQRFVGNERYRATCPALPVVP